MSWEVNFFDEAEKDLDELDGSQKSKLVNILDRVAENPLPRSEGGYGEPLGKHASSNLSGCLKIKLLKLGLRVVYRLIRDKTKMVVIVIGVRCDGKVYKEAERRIKKHLKPQNENSSRSSKKGKSKA